MGGDGELKQLLHEKYYEAQPRISNEGQWIAYMSDESGRDEIFARPYPEVDKGRWTVSTNGGNNPLWSPDGEELFYRNNDEIIAVTVKTEPAFEHGEPTTLFKGEYVEYSLGFPWDYSVWDISPDSKRFPMMKEFETADKESAVHNPRKINIVVNWFEELKQRVPGP